MRGVALALLCSLAAWADALLTGRVTDARTGEPLRQAEVRLGPDVARTGAEGRYELRTSATGEAELRATLVGYRPLVQAVRLSSVPSAGAMEIDFALHSDTLRQSQSVTVSAGPFDSAAAGGLDLAGSELRNLASVLADDPMRAVQSLPGVGAYSDFQSQFTVRGAGYERIGIYMDGILLHQPFHTEQQGNTTASLTLLQGEMLESAALEAGPLAPRYGDRGAGAVDFRTRDGDGQKRHVRATASASNAALAAEGPLGKKLTWIAAVRKSYLQYIIDRASDEPGLGFAFWDAQGKLSARVNEAQQLGLSVLRGHSGLDRSKNASRLGLLMTSDYDSTLVVGTWRMAAQRFLLTQRGAWLQEEYGNANRNGTPLVQDRYGERIWSGDAAVNWSARAVTEGGWTMRRVSDDGRFDQALNPAGVRNVERFNGAALRSGAYLQQTWSPGRGLEFRWGGRLDRHEFTPGVAASPFAALAFPLGRIRTSFSWGHNAQFGDLRQFLSPRRQSLPAERSQHLQLALDAPFGERSRLRFELFERRDRDLLFRQEGGLLDARGRLFFFASPGVWGNSLRGLVRGGQVMWQKRSANGLTGWVAYTYARTNYSNAYSSGFISDYDLRYQFQAFLSYRLRPTVNVSGRYVYATGLPLRGYFERRGSEYFVSAARNQLRLPDYQRWDLRVNKAYVRKHFQATLFAEVVNLTNRRNLAIDDLTGVDLRTGRARVVLTRTFPILPSAGVVFDF